MEVIKNARSVIIKAPPQFGLTSLGHYFVREAWEKGNLWIYLDSNETKAHNIHNAVIREVESLKHEVKDIKAIILDSWNNYEKESFKNNTVRHNSNLVDFICRTVVNATFQFSFAKQGVCFFALMEVYEVAFYFGFFWLYRFQ